MKLHNLFITEAPMRKPTNFKISPWEKSKWWPESFSQGIDPEKIAFSNMFKSTIELFPEVVKEHLKGIYFGGNSLFDHSSNFNIKYDDARNDWLTETPLETYYERIKLLAEALHQCDAATQAYKKQCNDFMKFKHAQVSNKTYGEALKRFSKIKVPHFKFLFENIDGMAFSLGFDKDARDTERGGGLFSRPYGLFSGTASSSKTHKEWHMCSYQDTVFFVWQSLINELSLFDVLTDSLFTGSKKSPIVSFTSMNENEFNCEGFGLTSLEGAGETFTPLNTDAYHMEFHCENNKLTSLEGAPKYIEGGFECNYNKLTSLENIHKHIKRINGEASFWRNEITSNVLGLLHIDGLEKVYLDNKEVEKIINKYLPKGDILDCQEELIDAGFEDYAQL